MTVQDLLAILVELPMDARVTCAGLDLIAHMEPTWYDVKRTAITPDRREVVLILTEDAPRNQDLVEFAEVLGKNWRNR